MVQEEGFEPTSPLGATNLQSVPAHHLRCSCYVTLRDISSPIGLIRQAFVLAVATLCTGFAIIEHLCSVELIGVFRHEVIFHFFLLYWWTKVELNHRPRLYQSRALTD